MDRVNEKLQENSSEVEVQVEKKKSVPDEMSNDEPLTVPEKELEVRDHSVILDTDAASIHKCFSTSGKLYKDFAGLDPEFFFRIKRKIATSTSTEEAGTKFAI